MPAPVDTRAHGIRSRSGIYGNMLAITPSMIQKAADGERAAPRAPGWASSVSERQGSAAQGACPSPSCSSCSSRRQMQPSTGCPSPRTHQGRGRAQPRMLCKVQPHIRSETTEPTEKRPRPVAFGIGTTDAQGRPGDDEKEINRASLAVGNLNIHMLAR